MSKQMIIMVCCILTISVIGIISNILFGYMLDISVIVRDIVLSFKFLLVYLCGAYLIKSKCVLGLTSKIILLSKVIIVVIFACGILSLFFDIGMGDDVRYGIKSYRFIYSHYTYLVYYELIVMSMILLEEKNNVIYYVMGIISLMQTMRTKAFMVVAFFVLFVGIMWLRKNKEVNFKSIFKLRIIVPTIAILYFVSRNKILEYITWGRNSSIRIGMHLEGLNLANQHFPLGTGFGTYGTNISYENGSKLYSMLTDLNYENLLIYGGATISDVYWPSIYAQFGFIGFVLFGIALLMVASDMFKNRLNDNKTKESTVCIIVYFLIASIAEAIFSNSTGVFGALAILLLILISNERTFTTKKKEYS